MAYMAEEQESTKDNADPWVSSLLEAARKDNPLVPESVFARLEILFGGQLTERELTPANLKAVATQLIGDTAPKPPESGETQ